MSLSQHRVEDARSGDDSELAPLGTRTDAVEGGGGPSGSRPWIVTVVAGLVALGLGLGLGVLLGFLLEDDGDGGEGSPAAAVEETPVDTADPPTADGTDDVVPQRCIDALELADDGLVLLDRALTSVGDLDPGRLDTVLESAEELRPDLERAIEDCRDDL